MIMESDDQPHDQVLRVYNSLSENVLRCRKSRALINT